MKEFKGQNFEKLLKTQLEYGVPFTDPLFPPNNSSLFYSNNKNSHANIVWKRPGELCTNPKLFVEGISSGDVFQGQLGNCWFVAACSVLAGVKELWNKVIPDYSQQEWCPVNKEKYGGIFHFRFWRFGEWIDVVIDDLLPTIGGKLIYTHSQSKNEFWCALLEKAYAKVNGTYQGLDGGNLSDALLDFSGGISEMIDLKVGNYTTDEEKRTELYKRLLKHKENHALMCCAVEATTSEEMEARTAVGLVKGHAYSITAIRKVNLKDTRLLGFLRGRERINMVRLRNPWGEKEWSGSFSDGGVGPSGEGWYVYSTSELTRLHSRSPEWQRISESERTKLGLTFEEDGEFWMTFDDFVTYFTEVSVCHLLNTSLFTFSRRWMGSSVYGHWTTGPRGSSADRAGGCANNVESFLRNPQYCFTVDSDDEEFIVQLSQPDVREKRADGVKNMTIGLHILKVEDNRKYRVHCKTLKTVGTSDYINTRSVIFRKSIDRGRYVVLPTNFAPDVTGDFLLRFYATCNANFKELKLEAPAPSIWCCISPPTLATSLTVVSVQGLANSRKFHNGPDTYCIIKCEGKSLKSSVVKDSTEPTWNLKAIFYRKDRSQPIIIEVWNRNMIRDSFIGQGCLNAINISCPMTVELTLKGRKERSEETIPGMLFLDFTSEEDFLLI